jgi:hypothetical protein
LELLGPAVDILRDVDPDAKDSLLRIVDPDASGGGTYELGGGMYALGAYVICPWSVSVNPVRTLTPFPNEKSDALRVWFWYTPPPPTTRS